MVLFLRNSTFHKWTSCLFPYSDEQQDVFQASHTKIVISYWVVSHSQPMVHASALSYHDCVSHYGWAFRSSQSQREAGDVWCLCPIRNLRAVIWFHFTTSSLVLLPTPIAPFLSCPWREARDVWYLPPVMNLRAVIWFHFAISSLVLQPSPFTLSVLSFSACWSILLNFFLKILQYFLLRDRLFCMAPA